METDRLILRPFLPEDESAFLDGVSDAELRRLYGFPAELSAETARRIFARFLTMTAACALVRKADPVMIGFVLDVPPELPAETLQRLPRTGRTLAFAVFSPYQRQGFMREGLAAVIRRHAQAKDAAFLHGGHFPDNEPSRRLLRSLGFTEFGRHVLGKAVIVDEVLFL